MMVDLPVTNFVVLRNKMREIIRRGQLSHGYVFTGSDESGKRQLTRDIIQTLACPEPNAPCGKCHICQRLAHNQVPDIFYLQPDGQSIKVDQIRQLREWLSTSPVEVDFKMAVIEQAASMNPAASNALLTFLEEPVDGVYLILYSPEAQKLLPTIQSRVQEIHFQDHDIDTRYSVAIEKGVSPAHATILARLPLLAMETFMESYEVAQVSEWLDHLNYFYRLLLQKDAMAFVAVESHLKNVLTQAQALAGLEYLWLLNYSCLTTQQDTPSDKQIQAYLIQEWQQSIPLNTSDLLTLSDNMLQCKEQILANVSPKLALESLAIQAIL